MNEIMARSLSPKELAEEFRYHDDPGVSRLASIVIENGRTQEEIEQVEELADMRAAETESQIEQLKDLLIECEDQLPERCKELRERITDAIA